MHEEKNPKTSNHKFQIKSKLKNAKPWLGIGWL
jgi:hypothetical protein